MVNECREEVEILQNNKTKILNLKYVVTFLVTIVVEKVAK